MYYFYIWLFFNISLSFIDKTKVSISLFNVPSGACINASILSKLFKVQFHIVVFTLCFRLLGSCAINFFLGTEYLLPLSVRMSAWTKIYVRYFYLYYAQIWKRVGILFCECRSVGLSVHPSVSRPTDFRPLSWELFIPELSYFTCWLVLVRTRPLLILNSLG